MMAKPIRKSRSLHSEIRVTKSFEAGIYDF